MMFRSKSAAIILVLLLLSGISVYLYLAKSKPGTADKASRDFAFKDTAAITRIFIADKDGHQSDLVRTKSGWVVNNKFPCRAEGILNLLEVIKYVEVKTPVAKEAKKNVVRVMAAKALKVQIYTSAGRVKQYYVGHETEDSEGSFMILSDPETGENYPDPFACFIPGFKGFLQPRYIANENEWRDRLVMNYTPPQLKEITVQLNDQPTDSSFSIELANTNTFRLKNANGKVLEFDEARMKQYLVYFQNVSYEKLISGMNVKLQDSLAALKPFASITVRQTAFNKTEVFKFYRKQFTGEFNPELGVKYDYDPDRFFLRFAGDKEWALCQYFVFGKLLIGCNYFAKQPPAVKK